MPPPSPTPIQIASAELAQRAVVELGVLGAVAVTVPAEVEPEATGVALWPLAQPARSTAASAIARALATVAIVPYASVVPQRKEVRR